MLRGMLQMRFLGMRRRCVRGRAANSVRTIFICVPDPLEMDETFKIVVRGWHEWLRVHIRLLHHTTRAEDAQLLVKVLAAQWSLF